MLLLEEQETNKEKKERKKIYILGASKTVRFPHQVAIYSDFLYCFLNQHRSKVATRLNNKCTAYQRLDRRGVNFPSKTTTALIT